MNKCNHVGPNIEKCVLSENHKGLHESRVPVFGEYGRKESDYKFCQWNDSGQISPEDYGCSVPLINFDSETVITQVIDKVLLQDARKTLEKDKVIEIRAKLEKDGIAWYYLPSPEDCPAGFEKQYSMQQTPLFDFEGDMQEKAGGYLLLARIKL